MTQHARSVLTLKLLPIVLVAAAAAMTPSSGEAATFGDGIHAVGGGIAPATYRTRVAPTSFCYWARLSGFGGTLDEILSNSFSDITQVVTISPSDVGFESDGCGTWTTDLSAITGSPTAAFSNGTFIVGVDVSVGTWLAPGGSS